MFVSGLLCVIVCGLLVQLPLAESLTVVKPIDNLHRPNDNDIRFYYQRQIGAPIAAECQNNLYFRSLDGSCNWLVKDQHQIGSAGTPLHREYDGFHSYSVDSQGNLTQPRSGPNPRLVSQAFFKRREKHHSNGHTQLLSGLVEFMIHDLVQVERDFSSAVQFEVPDNDEFFVKDDNSHHNNHHFKMYDSKSKLVGGVKQTVNSATSWLDLSPLYGTTKETCDKLRSFKDGKLKVSADNYLPFTDDIDDVKINKYRHKAFVGGDPRTNQDWTIVAVHTLLLRNHNRLCDIIKSRYGFDNNGNSLEVDEQIFQYARTANVAGIFLILASYQASYFKGVTGLDNDGTSMIRSFYDKSQWQVNNFYTYPWQFLRDINQQPVTVSQESAIGYRFHDFLPERLLLIKQDANGHQTSYEKDLVSTTYDSLGFVNTGLETVLRGLVNQQTPDFGSGYPDNIRNVRSVSLANPNETTIYDMAAFSVMQERLRGLPTFNQLARANNQRTQTVQLKVRERFEDFSSDPVMVERLKQLYSHPDEVDLLVGVELDEESYPKTTAPRSAVITSIINLFLVAAYDRFSPAYSMMQCLLVQKPWNCQPVTALDSLLWRKVGGGWLFDLLEILGVTGPSGLFPNMRWFDEFWLEELDIPNVGSQSLWKLITKNSDVDCLQLNPLFVAGPDNPVVCKSGKMSGGSNSSYSSSSSSEKKGVWSQMPAWLVLTFGLAALSLGFCLAARSAAHKKLN